MTEPVIKSVHLGKKYGNIQVLNGIDLEIMRGEFCVIAGPNGAGKTTFLRILYGELKPSEGEIFVAPAPTPLGVMPQEATLYEDLSVWEHVYYLTLLKGIKKDVAVKKAERAIRISGLKEIKGTLIRELSGGFKRRVSFAQALAGSEDLLLLDEPTAGLDPEARRTLLNTIKELHKKGTTIIFTTHYLDEVEREVGRVVIFNRGKIIYNGDKRGIMDRIGYDYEIETKYDENRVRALEELNVKFGVEKNILHVYLRKEDLREKLFHALGQDITLLRPSLEEAYLREVEG